MTALYKQLDAANHSVSLCAHMMEIDPSDRTIADYEKALDYAASIRAKIGSENRAELHRLDVRSGRVRINH